MKWSRLSGWIVAGLVLAVCSAWSRADSTDPPALIEPLFRVVDINVGETVRVKVGDREEVSIRVAGLEEQRCELRDAVRRAVATVEIDGQAVEVVSGTCHLPRTLGRVQVDCPVTRGYIGGSSKDNVWALDKDLRLRLWPAGSPWVRHGTFVYPVNQRWFASDTQMSNEPCYVNACDVPGQKKVYYHYGLDFGGAEGLVGVFAATDGVIVSRGGEIVPGEFPPMVRPRRDVVYVRDRRGWFYRYSHLQSIDPSVKPGGKVELGARIGTLGKEGGSGGWSHLHFDISMPQPSGRYGITDGYAFAFQACRERDRMSLVAVARPHLVARTGDPVSLDASRSWHVRGPSHMSYRWVLSDGTERAGARITQRYPYPGQYTETLMVTDRDGRVSYDFAVVQVFDREQPLPVPPAIHAACWPTGGIGPGDDVVFKVRSFGLGADEGEEVWDFGDGTPPERARSDGNARVHAPDGYATVTHRYEKRGDYFVTVRRKNDRGHTATGRLWVRVE
jgi:murein DD-endopeptidase MepM/ murein hydrolase activator NlpD